METLIAGAGLLAVFLVCLALIAGMWLCVILFVRWLVSLAKPKVRR